MKKTILLFASILFFSASAVAQNEITVTHGSTPAPTYIDAGEAGDSVGDLRIWSFSGQSSDNESVLMHWLMTTVGHADAVTEMESRTTDAVIAFGEEGKDSILLRGIGLYPVAGSTLKTAVTVERAVIGGTGRFAGAAGIVISTHLPDDTWQHVFKLD
jgi:hypothetical protein